MRFGAPRGRAAAGERVARAGGRCRSAGRVQPGGRRALGEVDSHGVQRN